VDQLFGETPNRATGTVALPIQSNGIAPAKASILVGLLWCLALLSVVVIGVLHTARLDLMVVKNHGDRIQAHYLALAGIEKAKALLYQNARLRTRSRTSHSGELYNAPEQFRDVPLGRGQFRVLRPGRADEGGGVIYGVSDEESRLNVNYSSVEQLTGIYGMTPDVVAAINDWRDADNAVSPGGAEAEYYSSLRPPYLQRNGPFQTVRELLMVRGISRELLLGRNANQNGSGDLAEGLRESAPPDNPASLLDSGWASIFTVDSLVQNLNAAGEDRINIQSADESALTAVRGITTDIAKAIVAYRGQNRLENLADLLEITQVQNQGQPPVQPGPGTQAARGGQPPQAAPPPSNRSGPKVVSDELFMDIADDLTTESGKELPGLLNINTAGLIVLSCVPGIDRQLAQAIISYRQSNGYFSNIAGLLKVPGMNREIFKRVTPLVTARSETYRILSEGKVTSSGARQRIQVIVRVGLQDIQTLSYREDL
jgi:competence ComEA-like helix-hairpin-helix protein